MCCWWSSLPFPVLVQAAPSTSSAACGRCSRMPIARPCICCCPFTPTGSGTPFAQGAHLHTLFSRSCSPGRGFPSQRCVSDRVLPSSSCLAVKVEEGGGGFWSDRMLFSSWILSFALSMAKSSLLPLRGKNPWAPRDSRHHSGLIVPRG